MQKNLYGLTNPQKLIWFTEEFNKGTPIENITGTVIISEAVNFDLLEKAINIFVEHNDNFRLKFVIDNRQIKQYVESYSPFSIKLIDINSENDLHSEERKIASTTFNTVNSFLYTYTMFRFPDNHGGFILNIHHLISDAWSSGLTASEIIKIYTLLLKNESLADITYPSYIDYIHSEQEYLQSEKFNKDKTFWTDLYKNVPEIATIPSSNLIEKKDLSNISHRKKFTIPKEYMTTVNNFCKQKKVSVFNFFMAIFSVYISKASVLDEFVIGTPILNRSNVKEKRTTGMFVNTVPLKITIQNNMKFIDLATNISTNLFSLFKHQKYSYLSLLEDLRHIDNTIPNLYRILVSYQNMHNTANNSEVPYSMDWIPSDYIPDDIDIHIYDMNDTGNVNIAYDYLCEKYNEQEIINIHNRILYIIKQVLKNNDILINSLKITTPEEENIIINYFNNTEVTYDKLKTISMLFEKQALKTPDRVALVFENKEMTYKELNEKSNSLAFFLRKKHISRNDIVGIMVNRSFELIISILAVLKSGGTYIPIDPDYPQDRIQYMLDNSNAKFLLTFSKLKDKVDFKDKIFVELDNSKIYSLSSKTLKNINEPEDSSYVIYTSGSTGLPKGVVLTHRALSNLTNYCNNYISYLKDNTYRAIVSVTTVSFDIFIFETLISLQRGLKLVITNEDEQNIPRLLNNVLQKNNVTAIQTTPSRMQLFVNNYKDIPALKNLEFITLAGEQLPITLANELKNISGATIYNGYGPSETTVFSTLTDVTNYDRILIGKPLDNTKIYILDKDLHLVPIGTTGELYIAGDGLGKGYLNREDLTKKSFIPNPFIKGTLMYKTGDLGCFMPNGEIMCLGRSDNQVKIRGLRIELEEIEHKILDNEDITTCVVAKKIDENSHEFLCAYYVATKTIDINLLRKDLSAKLPNYMVPQYFIALNELPYTPNGKVNRKALPMPKIGKEKAVEIVSPRNDTDSALVSILKDLIGVKEISMNSSFFDLGGDSLTAINLCSSIYDKFGVQLSIKDIMQNEIIMDLSNIISETQASSDSLKLINAPIQNAYPVSSAQSRIYYSCVIAGKNSTVYNMTGGLLLDNMPDVKKIEKCFQTLTDRHESLRTYFEINNDKLVQKIKDKIDFKLEIDNSLINENEIKEYCHKFTKPFDLSKAPLLRAKLIKIADSNKALLLIDIHHIICDGTSIQILIDELCKLYNLQDLPELNVSYKDFAWSENKLLASPDIKEAEDFWCSEFKNDIPVLEMPTNFPRPDTQSFAGSKVYFNGDSNLVSKINNICKELGVTQYMFTLAAYYILLHNYSMQDDIVVGSPIAGRSFANTSNLIGMFVNTLPIRMSINTNSSFKDFLIELKNKCLSAFKYQTYPLDVLINKLNIKRDVSRNPLFDTLFTFQNTKTININLGNINGKIYSNDNNISKFDLSLEIIPKDNQFAMNFEYCTKLFKKEFIENLSNHYLNILNILADNVNIELNKINIPSENKLDISKQKSNTNNIQKVDKSQETQIVSPRNDIDSTLLAIFKKLINTQDINMSSSFFDLGGDSLTAINLCTRIYDNFGFQLSIKDIFKNPIIVELSDVISNNIENNNKLEITKAPMQKTYPVSCAQSRIYYASILDGNNSVLYNIPGGLLLDNMPDIKKLEKCFQALIDRHESLRTYFEMDNNKLVQKIKDKINFKLEIDNSLIKENKIKEYYNQFTKPFDLSKAPLLRAKLIKIADSNKALLLIDIHHIICDGTSIQILIDELCKLYNLQDLPELNVSYKDFAWSENKLLASPDIKEAEDFWCSEFKNDIPVLEMPTNFPRPDTQSFAGSKVYFNGDSNLVSKINNICKELGVTQYMFTLAAYYILLHNYSMQDDIVVGSPIAGRSFANTSNLIGMFVNTLPIRMSINTNSSFKDFLIELKNKCLSAFKYQTYPLDVLINKLNIKRDVSRNPLFDTLFTFQNTKTININLGNINGKIYSNDNNISKFDLSLEIIPKDNQFAMNFEYCTKLFKKDFIENLSNHYLNILNILADNVDILINNIDMLSSDEKNKLIYEFNNNSLDYPKNSNIKEIFENQVRKSRNDIAVIDGLLDLSYNELNEKANSLAHYLLKNDIQKGDIIPVIMDKSLNLIISMFAIIKAGAIYLPISTEYPQDRINYILDNSNAKIALTTTNNNLINNDKIQSILVDTFDYNKYSNKNIDIDINPNDILYIIYTSSLTDNLKGTRISHRNLANLIYSFTNSFEGISSNDNCLSSTNTSFDVCIWEFFITLLNGATLYLCEDDTNNLSKYCKSIIKNNITLLYLPTNILDEVQNILSTYSHIPINKLLVSGENIASSIIKKYYSLKPDIKIINGYALSEATIFGATCILDNNILSNYKTLPIGKPINNSSIYILNNHLSPVPVNVPGTIYISGDNIYKGYLNNKELNDISFIELPAFNCKHVYKSDDLAKWNEDGTISFIGKSNDIALEVNGQKIELNEITSLIYQYPNISKAIVLLNKDQKIIAYFSSEKTININDLKAFMQRKLPAYFIPDFFVQVDKFKLSNNGQIDTKALRKIDLKENNQYEPPHTDYQKQLAESFKKILKLDKISINDNFFELGGDSLYAIQLQIDAFNKGLEFSYRDIFTYPTIKQLSENVLKASPNIIKEDNYDYSKINELIGKNKEPIKMKKDKIKNILLTGATGYMGSHILDNLLKNTKCNIYCLIRAKNNNDPQTRLLNILRFYFGTKYDKYIFKRIFAIEGDITDKKLGLTDMYYQELGNSVSCVINSAAIVKHYGDSSIFNEINIEGVQNIINFCSSFNCKLIHLSTLSVSGNIFETNNYQVANVSNDTIFSERDLYVGQDLSNIYIHTKFIAERLILEHILSGKLDAKIVRLGNITNRYSDGAFQINVSENAFLNRMHSFLQLGCIPEYLLDNYLEFTPVDICADAVVKITLYNNPYTIFHVYNNNHITFKKLLEILSSLHVNVQIVSEKEFNKKVKMLSSNDETKNIISGIINDFDKDQKLQYYTNIKFKNNFTNKFLRNAFFRWPKINEKYINKYIIYLKSIGYIK